LERDVTDVDKKAWFSEDGVVPDTWVANELLAPENPNGLVQSGVLGQNDEQDVLAIIADIMQKYSKGITAKSIKNLKAMQKPANRKLNENFMMDYGVSLENVVDELQDELFPPTEDDEESGTTDQPTDPTDDDGKTDNWKEEDNNDTCEAPF
jgi:hypothetical protein